MPIPASSFVAGSSCIASWWDRTPLNVSDQPTEFWEGITRDNDERTAREDVASHSSCRLSPVTSGLPSLDSAMGATLPGELICIASRPSMGKTALALQFCVAASASNRQVLFLSLDLNAPQLLLRYISAKQGIDLHRLRLGNLKDHDKEELQKNSQAPSSAFVIDDRQPQPWSSSLCRQVEASLAKMHLCSIVVIDALDTLFVDRTWYQHQSERSARRLRREHRVRRDLIDETMRDLRSLARAHQCTVIVTLPLGRGAERREDHRPKKKDLGAFASASARFDTTLLVYRPEVYFPDPALWGRTEVSICQRKKYVGATALLILDKRFAKFIEPDHSAASIR